MEQGEIILYQPEELIKLEVRLENETVWLNRQQMALLFGRDIKTIGKHISNAMREELAEIPVVAKFATTATDGKVYQTEHYNLDVILSVGYRVKSQQGIKFRQWANKVLKEYLLKGYSVNQRINDLEQRIDQRFCKYDNELQKINSQIDFFVRTSLPPVEGVFYDGQIFDAYQFASDLIRSAKRSVLLIDNYVDDSVLKMLSKRADGVTAEIYTAKITSQLQLDLEKHNDQYPPIDIKTYKGSHDRFLIIDQRDIFHIGASLKDLGKKMFAFSKMDIPAEVIIERLL